MVTPVHDQHSVWEQQDLDGDWFEKYENRVCFQSSVIGDPHRNANTLIAWPIIFVQTISKASRYQRNLSSGPTNISHYNGSNTTNEKVNNN
jgi:hypothetical protein